MPTTSPYSGLPVPTGGDNDNVPQDLLALAKAIELQLVVRFANSAARSTALTAAGVTTGTQLKGMLTWLHSPGRYEKHDGTQWLPLVPSKLVVSGAVLYGTAYDGVSLIIQQRYTDVVTTNGAGGFTTAFPQAFPNGLISVQFSDGDATGAVTLVGGLPSNHTLVQAQGILRNLDGSAVASSGRRLEVDAVGW